MSFSARFRLDGEAVDSEGDSVRGYLTREFEIALTWNEILRVVGSRLLDEAAEAELKSTLGSYLLRVYENVLDKQVISWLAELGYSYDGFGGTDYKISVSDYDFGVIIVQLKALGYTEQSQKNRSVKDRNKYWRLTPFGETSVIPLMAIPRGADQPPAGSSADDFE